MGKTLAIDLPIVIIGVAVVLIVKHFYADAEFKTVGLIVLAAMIAVRLVAVRLLASRSAKN